MTTAEAQGIVSIDIEKLVEGQDADGAPGPLVSVGSTVIFTYLVTGDPVVQLGNVVASDDNGTPGDPSDDFFPVFFTGDDNLNDLLDPGETWHYTAALTALAGQYENIGIVTGNDLIFGSLAFDADPGHYFGGTELPRVPEPDVLLLLAVGLAGIGYRCRSRRPHV